MQALVERNQLPGVVTMVAKDGKVVEYDVAGKRDVESGAPLQKDSIFRIYSMSKPITGVAMMLLFEEGKWQLNDPVSKHIPEFANLKVAKVNPQTGAVTPVAPDHPMTMRELMSHSGGLTYGVFGSTAVDKMYTDVNVLDSQTGDFTRDGGKKVMEGYLQKYGKDINVLFAHNDDMGLGALDAIKAAGLTPGKDIQIVTIDAVKDGMTALANGEFNFIVECNPLLGDKAAELVKAVVAGDEVEKRTIVEDQSFTQEQAAEVLDSRPY